MTGWSYRRESLTLHAEHSERRACLHMPGNHAECATVSILTRGRGPHLEIPLCATVTAHSPSGFLSPLRQPTQLPVGLRPRPMTSCRDTTAAEKGARAVSVALSPILLCGFGGRYAAYEVRNINTHTHHVSRLNQPLAPSRRSFYFLYSLRQEQTNFTFAVGGFTRWSVQHKENTTAQMY
ncbi:hypothetical protein NDU88_002640 [Pleurodeles waltl]|uniref:Uncharacterized protein n=1 Tax=Pleurodeles waltl TaxID=8319 RepID=A0AAV7TL91_PLEWA|nr:hypothetical protein NDU88_002640 [Pleurodeles waltl]